MKQLVTFAHYVLLEAIRTRFFAMIILLLGIGIGLALFLGQIALVENRASQTSLLAAFLRLSAVYAMSLFVIISMVREFNEHTIILSLSLPIKRSTYFFGKLIGFMLVASFVAILFGCVLLYYELLYYVSLWMISLLCELFIITTVSLLCVLTFNQTIQAFSAVIGFYALARSIGTIQLMGYTIHMQHTTTEWLFNQLITLLATLLPDLDTFTQSSWLVYHTGDYHDLLLIVIQTVVYIILLTAMSLFDLYRKNL